MRRPYLRLLGTNRNFRRLWTAQLISLGGDWFNLVALTGLAVSLTHSAAAGGVVLAAGFVPQFLLAPLTGVVADRFDRRRLMLLTNAAGAALALTMLAVRSAGMLWLGLTAMAGLAACGAFFDPASRAGLPNVVRPAELGPASILMASTWGIMAAVGAAAGGVVAGLLGRDAAFVINGGSFVVSALLICRVRTTLGPVAPVGLDGPVEHPAPQPQKATADVREGITHARRDPRIAALLTQKLGFGLGTGMIGLLPFFATHSFHASDAGIGILYAARGLGTLLGPFPARAFVGGDTRRLFPAIGAAMALFGAAYLAFPAAPGIWAAAGIVTVAHLGGGTQVAMTGYGIQVLVPDRVRGRILALELGTITLSMSTSLLLAGWAASAVRPAVVVEVLAGLTMAFAGVWTAATHRLWATTERASGAQIGTNGPTNRIRATSEAVPALSK
ncbi:MAG TPA: MFS transporter [Actinomycetota bacterium]|nr:MFS transporter [Actinomycetota bacterium]